MPKFTKKESKVQLMPKPHIKAAFHQQKGSQGVVPGVKRVAKTHPRRAQTQNYFITTQF